jgi:hypothetical protein
MLILLPNAYDGKPNPKNIINRVFFELITQRHEKHSIYRVFWVRSTILPKIRIGFVFDSAFFID